MFIPFLISEREAGEWEDCVWATGVMLANGIAGADVHPPTRAEYEALRVAGGDGPAENPGDGSRLSQLVVGLRVRYGVTAVRLGNGWDALLAAAPAGTYVALNGHTRALPARLRVAQAANIPHTLLIARDATASALVLDPARTEGADPQRATLGELRAFHEALPGAAWLTSTETQQEVATMAIQIRHELAEVAPATDFYDAPGGDRVGEFSKAATVRSLGVPMDESPDSLNLGWRAVEVLTTAIDGVSALKVMYVLTLELVNLRPAPPPEDTAGDPDAFMEGRRTEWARWATALNIPPQPEG